MLVWTRPQEGQILEVCVTYRVWKGARNVRALQQREVKSLGDHTFQDWCSDALSLRNSSLLALKSQFWMPSYLLWFFICVYVCVFLALLKLQLMQQ